MKPLSKEEIDRCYNKWGCVPLDTEWVRSSSHFISDAAYDPFLYTRIITPFRLRMDWDLPREWIDIIKSNNNTPLKGGILIPGAGLVMFDEKAPVPKIDFYIKNQTHTNNKTMQEQILSEVSEILVENYGLRYDEITPEANLDENLDLDSLDRVEFLTKIEDKFNIRAQDDDLETLKTVQDVITYIDDRINAHRPS